MQLSGTASRAHLIITTIIIIIVIIKHSEHPFKRTKDEH